MADFYDDNELNETDYTSLDENSSSEDVVAPVSESYGEIYTDIQTQEYGEDASPADEENLTENDSAEVAQQEEDNQNYPTSFDSDPDEEELTSTKRKIKSNKPIAKKKKIAVAIISAVCVVGLLLGIILPIVFFHAPRIFVKNPEDFTASKQGSMDKIFYSLDKNIDCPNLNIEGDNVYSIDLNKHTLKVNDTLNIKTAKKGTFYIGTRKSKNEYTNKKANLVAKTINIEAENLDVVLEADVKCESLVVKAKSLTIANAGNGSYARIDMNLSANAVTFKGNVSGSAISSIEIFNCPDVKIRSGKTVGNTLSLNSSHITMDKGSNLSTLNLDSLSTAAISGNITVSVIGGKQVVMKDGHSCNTYQDIATLVIFRNTSTSHLIKGCESVIYVEKLAKPNDIIIEERDNKVYCKSTRVKYATGYKFFVNDKPIDTVVPAVEGTDPELDITEYVKAVGKYTIGVCPVGNYTEGGDFTNVKSTTMYIDGDVISTTYNCVLTLQAPTELKINDDKVLTFHSVLHAQSYKIFVDGKEIKRKDPAALSEDLTQYLAKVGNHSVKVQAINNSNSNIKDSPASLIAYSTTERLDSVDKDLLKASINDENTAISVSWQGVANGYEYIVYLSVDGGEKIEVGRTSILNETGITYTINFEDLKDLDYDPDSSYEVTVVAAAHDYYNQSGETQCQVQRVVHTPEELK